MVMFNLTTLLTISLFLLICLSNESCNSEGIALEVPNMCIRLSFVDTVMQISSLVGVLDLSGGSLRTLLSKQ
ncbi:hypothetical protein C5167_006193 [Papaver somniferum]|uniref:Uncharacterized protein n=1 Tax=Papaver somniferum TaxID=3469 RepID=A0A4Y7JFV2_PAPSO|nr:hypothetical protein C5167_006193 [Papaver somniferum]